MTRVSSDVNDNAFDWSNAKDREGVEITMSGLSANSVLSKSKQMSYEG